MEFAAPPPPLPAPKPAALTVLGILNILFGAIGLISALFTIKLYVTPLESQTGLMADMLRSDAFFASCMRVIFFPGIIFAVLQLVTGIGMLRSSELARKTAVACAFYSIVVGLFVGWLNVRYMMPFTVEHTLQQLKDPAVAEMTRRITQGASYFGIALGLLYPVLGLILLSRAKVRQFCIARSC